MKKHRMAILAAALLSTLTASAQLDYQASWPQSLKLVKVTATDVNLRRSASAKSARLMRICEDESDICYLEWSGQSRHQGYPVHPEKGELMQKTGTQGEWTRLKVEEGFEAYMLSKFCTENIGSFTALTASDKTDQQVFERTSGQYAGLCLMADEGGMDTDCGFYIGQRTSQGYVFKYFLPTSFYMDESLPSNNYKVNVDSENDNARTLTYGRGLTRQDSFDNTVVNLNRFDDRAIKNVIENGKAKFQKVSVLVFKTSDGEIHRLDY